MSKIFISYRRQDTRAIVGRVFDRLEMKFGRDAIFVDIDSIPPGVDFHAWLNSRVAEAVIVVALIGPGWADVTDETGRRRLDNPNDFVRIEIEATLARDIPLIPLLIDGAQMPDTKALPETMQALTRRNASFLDSGRDFNANISRLIEALKRHLSGAWPTTLQRVVPMRYEDKKKRLIRTLPDTGVTTYWCHSIAITPDGRYGLSAAGSLKLWDLSTGRRLCNLRDCDVRSAGLTADGRYAFFADCGPTERGLKLYDLSIAHELDALSGPIEDEVAVALTPDGRFGLSWAGKFLQDKELKMWDLFTGRELRTLTNNEKSINSIALTADGRFALSAGGGRRNQLSSQAGPFELKLWDLTNGRQLHTLIGHTGVVTTVAITPDGRYGLSGSEDGTIRVWEISTGDNVHTITPAKNDKVISVAFTEDGRYGLTASGNSGVTLWEIPSGNKLFTFEEAGSVAMTPDGRFALSACDGGMKLWDISEWTQPQSARLDTG